MNNPLHLFRSFTQDTDKHTQNVTRLEQWARAMDEADIALDTRLDTVETARVCRVYRNAALNIPNNAVTTIVFDTETEDENNWHNPATGVITPTLSGWYWCYVNVAYAGNAAGSRQAQLQKNGSVTAIGSSIHDTAAYVARESVGNLIFCNGTTDTISAAGFQDSGAALALQVGSENTFLTVHYVGT